MKFDWRGLVGGLSSALPEYAKGRAARRAADDLGAGEAELRRKQLEADAAIGDEITRMETSNPEGERVRSLADYTTALQRSRLEKTAPSQAPNLGGTAFKADAAAGAQQGAQELRRTADLTSRIDAPMYQRQREGQSAARTAFNARELGRQGDTAAYLAKLRAQRRRPSPWVALLSQLGTAVANNYEPSDGLEEIVVDAKRLPRPVKTPPIRQMPDWRSVVGG